MMKRARLVLLVIGAVLALYAVADDSLPALEAVDCVPGENLRGNAARGSDLHLENCAECHGYDGRAEVIVMHMDEPPKDQSDPAYMSTLTDGFLYLAICRGGEAVGRSIVMPAWGDVLSDQDIRDLIAHMRTFSGT
jgi:cytochrome c oxidase cbb3-type subunit 3